MGCLVRAVTCVDDCRATVVGRSGPLCDLVGGARSRVAHDECVGTGRAQGHRGIAQGFTFGHRGTGCADIDDVGTHPFACHLERHPGARRVLEEHRHDRASAQRRELAYLSSQKCLLEPFCLVEKFYRGLTIEVRDGK